MKPPWKEGDSTRMFPPHGDETRRGACLARLRVPGGGAARRAIPAPPSAPWLVRIRPHVRCVRRRGQRGRRSRTRGAPAPGRQRVDERTIFHWASITKTLTAVAVMQLRDRGRLSLDDRVTRYLP